MTGSAYAYGTTAVMGTEYTIGGGASVTATTVACGTIATVEGAHVPVAHWAEHIPAIPKTTEIAKVRIANLP